MRRRTFQLAAKGIAFSLVLTSALVMVPASCPQVEAAEISDIEAQQAQVQSELASLDSNLVQVVKQLEDLQMQPAQSRALRTGRPLRISSIGI